MLLIRLATASEARPVVRPRARARRHCWCVRPWGHLPTVAPPAAALGQSAPGGAGTSIGTGVAPPLDSAPTDCHRRDCRVTSGSRHQKYRPGRPSRSARIRVGCRTSVLTAGCADRDGCLPHPPVSGRRPFPARGMAQVVRAWDRLGGGRGGPVSGLACACRQRRAVAGRRARPGRRSSGSSWRVRRGGRPRAAACWRPRSAAVPSRPAAVGSRGCGPVPGQGGYLRAVGGGPAPDHLVDQATAQR